MIITRSHCILSLPCRALQHDAHAVDLDLAGRSGAARLAVFDGYAGGEVARLCARHLVGGW
jgi:hypothetical protein